MYNLSFDKIQITCSLSSTCTFHQTPCVHNQIKVVFSQFNIPSDHVQSASSHNLTTKTQSWSTQSQEINNNFQKSPHCSTLFHGVERKEKRNNWTYMMESEGWDMRRERKLKIWAWILERKKKIESVRRVEEKRCSPLEKRRRTCSEREKWVLWLLLLLFFYAPGMLWRLPGAQLQGSPWLGAIRSVPGAISKNVEFWVLHFFRACQWIHSQSWTLRNLCKA